MIPPVPSRLSSVTEISNPEQNTRRTWLEDWEKHNRGQVRPCSAKAVYRVADSKLYIEIFHYEALILLPELDMTDLKARAFQVLLPLAQAASSY